MEKEQFSKRLVELRMNKGASARDMSLSIGQSAGYINNIENGVNLPSMSVFFYICEYLDGSGNAATYSNWQLMYSYTSAGVQTYGTGFSQSWSNGWSGVQTGIKGLLNANEVAFAMACRNGKGSYKLNLIDDDAAVAAFMSSNKALASYPKA
jgi:DNA-binding XRE family transcriptional regulator